MNNGANTARECEPTLRVSGVGDGYQCLASCGCHQLAYQGRRARYKGLRKNQFDGRHHAAVSNLHVAAHYAEERRLAS